jgi:hypothetical protein
VCPLEAYSPDGLCVGWCVGSFADELEGGSGENKLCYMHIFQLYVQHTGLSGQQSLIACWVGQGLTVLAVLWV